MKVRYLLLAIIFFLFISPVNAEDCDTEDINILKNLAEHVDIAYSTETIKGEEEEIKDSYLLKLSNLQNELYAQIKKNDQVIELTTENNTINYISPGTQKIEIYSSKCQKKIKTITLKLLYYNYYYESDKCKEYKNKIPSCKEWTKNEVNLNKISSEKKEIATKLENNKLNTIDIVKNNYIYILPGLLLLILLVVLIKTIINRRRAKIV